MLLGLSQISISVKHVISVKEISKRNYFFNDFSVSFESRACYFLIFIFIYVYIYIHIHTPMYK